MADNNQKDLVNTPKYSSEKKSSHPLKNIPFFGIPRHIALLPELTDRLFRLLSILCSAFGEDGHIEFKIKTLCKLMGGKSDKSTRRIIEEAEQLGLISTYQTGRSLVFNLTEKFYKNPISEAPDKNDRAERSKMTTPYPLEKKERKTTTTPLTPRQCEPPKLPPDSKAAVVVVSEFEILKNRLRDDLKPSFVDRTYRVLLDKGLSIGRMKTLIDEMNDSSARTCGWLMARVKDLEDPAAIPDADEMVEQERIRVETARKRHDERMEKLKVVSEKDNENSGKKIEKHIETYTNLPDEYKQLVFSLVLHKSRGEERKKRIMDAGADGLHEVENIGYRIQAAMKQMNMPGQGNPGRKDDEVR